MVAVLALVTVFAARAQASPSDGRDFDEDDDAEVDVPYGPAGGTSEGDRERRGGGPTALDGPCDCDAPTLARIAATAPSLPSIVAHAQAVAGLGGAGDGSSEYAVDGDTASSDPARRHSWSGNPVSGWRWRSRWSALIPVVSVRAGNSQSWRDFLDPSVAASSASAGATLNHSLSYDVRLGWRLERLLYDPNEPRFEAFELARRRERRKLAALASRAYFVWLRASVALERDGRWQLRADEAAAQLDALTDGWFLHELSRRESR